VLGKTIRRTCARLIQLAKSVSRDSGSQTRFHQATVRRYAIASYLSIFQQRRPRDPLPCSGNFTRSAWISIVSLASRITPARHGIEASTVTSMNTVVGYVCHCVIDVVSCGPIYFFIQCHSMLVESNLAFRKCVFSRVAHCRSLCAVPRHG